MISFKKAKHLASMHGTPLLVYSNNDIIRQYSLLAKNMDSVDMYYAVKANPYKRIIETLYSLGSGFDIASVGEIQHLKNILKNKFKRLCPDRILYTHPIKKEEEIEFAVRSGVRWFVLDNKYEIRKFRNVKKKVSILVRISILNPDAVVNLSYKFGCEPKDSINLIKKCIQSGLSVRGVCFHVGSQNLNSYKYIEALEHVREIFSICALSGINLDTIDIGGGFPVDYIYKVIPVSSLCLPIAEYIEKYLSGFTIAAEPGRFISAPAFTLITSVIGKAKRKGIWWYYIDDGLYGSFSGKVFDHSDYMLLTDKKGSVQNSIIAGPTCDSFDIVYKNVSLPEMNIGDMLVFPVMGAYTSATATEFNLVSKAKIIKLD
ncbi:type III PLP-dependent enzyme [Spirochaetota bacterium]